LALHGKEVAHPEDVEPHQRWCPASWCSRSRCRNPQVGGGGSAGPDIQLAPAGRLVDRRLCGDRQGRRTGTRNA
jgi:hypothetical protein